MMSSSCLQIFHLNKKNIIFNLFHCLINLNILEVDCIIHNSDIFIITKEL